MQRDWFSAFASSPFFPWSRGSRFFGPGEVRLALLSLLEEGPKHGYELMKDLEARSGGLYRASAGVIYPTLQQLEDEGLLVSEQQEGKRVYRLTEEGKREIEREREAIRRIWRRAESWGDWAPCFGPEAGMIARPIAAVAKAALRAVSHDTGDSKRVWKVREILERTARELEELAKEER